MYFRRTENIKSREVTGGVFESAPSAPPDRFFQLGQKHTISNFRGGICTVSAYALPVLKQGVHMHTAHASGKGVGYEFKIVSL